MGSMTIGFGKPGDASASVNDAHNYVNKEQVEVTTLDNEILTFAKNDRVAVIKIDVEGHEARVLKGLASALQDQQVECLIWERHKAWRKQLKLPSLKNEIDLVSRSGYFVYYASKDEVLRVDGDYWHERLEPRYVKLDVFAVRGNSTLNQYFDRKLLPSCRQNLY
eukprot:gene13524-15990_t